MESSTMNFCKNVLQLRIGRGLTRKQMAKYLNISTSKLRRIECCDPKTRITAQLLCRVCDLFGYSSDELLYDTVKA